VFNRNSASVFNRVQYSVYKIEVERVCKIELNTICTVRDSTTCTRWNVRHEVFNSTQRGVFQRILNRNSTRVFNETQLNGTQNGVENGNSTHLV